MMEKLEEAVMLTEVTLFDPFQDSQRKSTSHSSVPGRGNRAKLVTPYEYRRQHLNSETCSSSSSEYNKYESSTSGEYNISEYTSRCSSTFNKYESSTSGEYNISEYTSRCSSTFNKYESSTSGEYNISEYTSRCSSTFNKYESSTSGEISLIYKYNSSTSDEYNNEELSSSSTFISIYDEINFPDIPPLSPQHESTGSSHLHYNETQPGSKTSSKTTPLYKEKSNNNQKRAILILPKIQLRTANKRISDGNTLKENQPIKTSSINNNKPNTHKRNKMLEEIDKKEGKQNYGAKQSDLSLQDDSSDDEIVRQYNERQKSKHRPGGARRRRREREHTFYESNQAMCYDVTSNARRDETEPVSLPALDNLAGIPDMSRESRKKDKGFGQVKLPAITKKQIVTPHRGDLKRSKDDRVAQSLNAENMVKDVKESNLELTTILRVDKKESHKNDKAKKENPTKKKKSEKFDGLPPKNERKNAVDKLESLTAYQLLEAIPGALAKANTKKTKKMTPKQPITSQLPKLDVKKLSMLDRKLSEDFEEKASKGVAKRRTNK